MKVLITGAGGRIGKVLAEAFESERHEAIRFSRNANTKARSLSELRHHIADDPEVILHLAWSSVPATAEMNPGAAWSDDLPLLASILENCRQSCLDTGRSPLVVFFSSCSVYGEKQASKAKPFAETDLPNPKGWYARGKVAAENLIEQFRVSGVRALVLRISNPYGFSQDGAVPQGIIPTAVACALGGRDLSLWGDGSARKDFIHIDDLCQAVLCATEQGLTGVFNVCNGISCSVREVLCMLEENHGLKPIIKQLPSPLWDVQQAEYSNRLFCSQTTWSPKISLEQGVAELLRQIKDLT